MFQKQCFQMFPQPNNERSKHIYFRLSKPLFGHERLQYWVLWGRWYNKISMQCLYKSWLANPGLTLQWIDAFERPWNVSCSRERKSGRKLITAMNLCVQCAPYKCYLGDFKRIYHSNDTVPILPDKCICKTVMDACVCLQNGHKLCACVLGD